MVPGTTPPEEATDPAVEEATGPAVEEATDPAVEEASGAAANRQPAGRGSGWRVWRVIQALDEWPPSDERFGTLARDCSSILHGWGTRWAGDKQWQSLLNKSSLLHEVEEVMVAMHALLEWMETEPGEDTLTVVDVCAGKGIFTMCLTYLAAINPVLRRRVARVVMADHADINWHHIHAANDDARSHHAANAEACRSDGVSTAGMVTLAAVPIDLWGRYTTPRCCAHNTVSWPLTDGGVRLRVRLRVRLAGATSTATASLTGYTCCLGEWLSSASTSASSWLRVA